MYHHEVLEHGDFAQRQQVVRWIRRFPFAFLSDREYTIARREFKEEDGSIYACTKVWVVCWLAEVLCGSLPVVWKLTAAANYMVCLSAVASLLSPLS